VIEMWLGWDYPQQDSSLEDSRFNDENCVVRLDSAKTGFNAASPLADNNSRPKANLPKPASKEENFYQAAAQDKQKTELTSLADDIAVRMTALQTLKLSLEARERQVREQEVLLQQASGAEEVTKRALQRSEMQVATCEAEVEALQAQLTEQRRIATIAEDKVAAQCTEVQELHTALADVRREFRKSVNGSGDLMGKGRLPTGDEAPEHLKKRIRELEQALTADRVDLQALRLELKQAKQRLESKDAELESVLPALAANRLSGVQARKSMSTQNNAEVERLRRERDMYLQELEQVRPDMDRLRTEASRSSTTCVKRRSFGGVKPDESVEARLSMAAKLAEKRVALDRREQALADREAAVQQGLATAAGQRFGSALGAAQPAQFTTLPTYGARGGGGGIPDSQGIFGFLERFNCARRQTVVHRGYIIH